MKKPFPTYFEESAILYDWISVSAGMRGAQILMEPQALIDFVGAKTGDITRM
jgi:Cys-tRNA(Pro)/Cys-tRNA(Cys) deacylase